MKVKEIAKKYNVVPATVKVWIRENKLKAKITPRGYDVSEKQLQEFEFNHRFNNLVGK